ncbi:MAG: GGDEF domain-containing protein [Sandaracinaceae bacterium]|nr:GGDEF domain-containing protein [Sandaracinaceae bacterium]
MGDDPEDDGLDWGEDEGTVQLDLKKMAAATSRRAETAQPYLIVYAGNAVGRTVRVGEELTIGRGTKADLQLFGDGVSRLHARLRRVEGAIHVEDLGSTNGTMVNGEKIVGLRKLEDGDQIQVGVNLLLKFSLQDEAQARFQQELYEAALRDPLTNVYNRRAFDDRLEGEVSHAKRHGTPLALLLFDLDFFKLVNDTYGHLAGDQVLAEFAGLVQAMVRREDVFARYGGEEFAMICRSTPLDAAASLAERVRAQVASTRVIYETTPIPITVSIGVAALRADDTTDALIERTDKMLYRAKEDGRNRVAIAPES